MSHRSAGRPPSASPPPGRSPDVPPDIPQAAPSRIAISREPPATLARCELTYLERQPISIPAAQAQHQAYCAALEGVGCRVSVLPPLEDYPDSCFVEDTAIVLDEVIVLCRPGAASRLPEVDLIAPFLGTLRPLTPLAAPATLDGGDVVRLDRVLHVGLSLRTNRAGVQALRHAAEPFGYQVVAVPFRSCLHLKSACTALAPDTVLLNPDWVDPAHFEGLRVIQVAPEEPWAADLLPVGGEVLMNAAGPRTVERVAAAGYQPRPVDISEFMKAEGGVTCLSLVVEMA